MGRGSKIRFINAPDAIHGLFPVIGPEIIQIYDNLGRITLTLFLHNISTAELRAGLVAAVFLWRRVVLGSPSYSACRFCAGPLFWLNFDISTIYLPTGYHLSTTYKKSWSCKVKRRLTMSWFVNWFESIIFWVSFELIWIISWKNSLKCELIWIIFYKAIWVMSWFDSAFL